MNMVFKRKLPIPMETKEMYPLTPEMAAIVARRRAELTAVFAGESDRLVLVIGPCSADHEDSVIDYVSRLVRVQERVRDRLVLVPRVYTNKPRSTGDGYKGLVHQPEPGARPDLFRGIITMREMHMRVVKETGFAGADEMLYPENYKYIDDLVGYLTVGARSVEDQQHRLTASAGDCPVGMKNPTGGNLSVMVNAIHTAQRPHDFIYRGWEGHSFGNPYAHAVLRGYVDLQGVTHPNYDEKTLLRLAELFADAAVSNPGVVIDCNHANSGKDPFAQPRILREVLASIRRDPAIRALVRGFMVESYIVDGRQDVPGGVYGQSITDACLGWEKSERLIYDLAEAL